LLGKCHTLIRVALALVSVGAISGASAQAATPPQPGPSATRLAGDADSAPTTPAPKPLEAGVLWQLAGVGADHRSLLIGLGQSTVCGPPVGAFRGSLLAATTTAVQLALVFTLPSPCAATPIAPTLISVPIGRRVAGQKLSGAMRVNGPITPATWNAWTRGKLAGGALKMPSLAGLRIADAKQLLINLGLGSDTLKLTGGRAGYVAAQRPLPGKAFKPGKTAVKLRLRALAK
jgi:hypothetical protein